MEVVQQIGSDSFDPGHGVLISKTKNTRLLLRQLQLLRVGHRRAPGGHQPRRLRRPRRHAEDGDPGRRAPAERRDVQRRPELRLAPTSTRTTANRLHFYVVDKQHRRARASCTTRSASSSLDGAGPQTRGVALAVAGARATPTGYTTCTFNLKNTGAAAAVPANVHPQDAVRVPGRATSTASRRRPPAPAGRAKLKNALATAEVRRVGHGPGLHRRRRQRGCRHGHAERRPPRAIRRTQTAVCALADGDVGGTVPATLALTLGTPAAFGPFRPGSARTTRRPRRPT